MLPGSNRRTGISPSLPKRSSWLESLETRVLLSATLPTATPLSDFSPLTASSAAAPYTPAQIAAAYGFNAITLSNGVKGTGAGQTIAIVDAYNDPNIAGDLANFDRQWGLAAPASLKVESETGSSSLPTTNASWDLEIALDVEWAHAMAPGANILLVEANSASLNDLLSAVNTARNAGGVSVVSMSWGSSEFLGETADDGFFTTPAGHQGVTFVAASGDAGGLGGPEWPASSPNVLSVGGTTLSLANAAGAYGGETAWSGSTGGISKYESEPSYQTISQLTGRETSPDVSYDANPNTGMYVYDSVPMNGSAGWYEVGGTSAGAPQWASLIAIANQGRALKGVATLNGTSQTLPTLFSLYTVANYNQAFNDVIGGNNGRYAATQYYDAVTGLGSPKVNFIVQTLSGGSINTAAKTTTTTTTTKTTTTAVSHESPGKEAFTVSQPLLPSSGRQLFEDVHDVSPVSTIGAAGNVTISNLMAVGAAAFQSVNGNSGSVHAVVLDAATLTGLSNMSMGKDTSTGIFQMQNVTGKQPATNNEQTRALTLASSGIGMAGNFDGSLKGCEQWKKWTALVGVAIFVGLFDMKTRRYSQATTGKPKTRATFNWERLEN